MITLSAFLEARYAEAEATAMAAAADAQRMAGRAHWSAEGSIVVDAEDADWAIADLAPWVDDECLARHIAATDPAHRLRDIALKRAILAEHKAWHEQFEAARRELGTVGGGVHAGTRLMGHMLRLLGTEFCDHPEYEKAWRP